MKQLYKKEGAEIGPVVGMVKFAPGEEQVTLDTSDETWIKDGWSLCPLRLLCVSIYILLNLILKLSKCMIHCHSRSEY